MTDSPAVVLRDISKRYGVVRALKDVSLTIERGEVLGLVGENGAGKSTLIGVLGGTVKPDRGELVVHGHSVSLGTARSLRALGVSVVAQEQALVETMRVYENLYLGREAEVGGGPVGRAQRLRAQADRILKELGIPVPANAFVSSLTYPQRQMVEIAKAFGLGTRSGQDDGAAIILLDEPTSALSEREVEILFGLIRRWQPHAAFIFVSHILNDVLQICTRLAVLRDGSLVSSVPNIGLSAEQVHELMVGSRRSQDYYEQGRQSGPSADRPVLELRDAAVAGSFHGVDLAVRPGEVVGVTGVVGSGADAVLAALAGAVPLSSGEILVDGQPRRRWSVSQAVRAGVLYVPPERANDSIIPTMSIRQNISIGFLDLVRSRVWRFLRLGLERNRTRALAEQLQIKARSLTDSIGSLSGGNQQKVVLARWQGRESVALVLNDPTRGIDVGTRQEIYQLIRGLAEEGKAILLYGESLEEVIGMSDRVIVMRRGAVSGQIDTPAQGKPTETTIVPFMV